MLTKKSKKKPARAGLPRRLALVRATSRAEVDVIDVQRWNGQMVHQASALIGGIWGKLAWTSIWTSRMDVGFADRGSRDRFLRAFSKNTLIRLRIIQILEDPQIIQISA